MCLDANEFLPVCTSPLGHSMKICARLSIAWVVLAVSPGTAVHPHVSNCSLPFLHFTASLATGSNKPSPIPGTEQFSKEDFTAANVCIPLTVLCQDKQDPTFTPALVAV